MSLSSFTYLSSSGDFCLLDDIMNMYKISLALCLDQDSLASSWNHCKTSSKGFSWSSAKSRQHKRCEILYYLLQIIGRLTGMIVFNGYSKRYTIENDYKTILKPNMEIVNICYHHYLSSSFIFLLRCFWSVFVDFFCCLTKSLKMPTFSL